MFLRIESVHLRFIFVGMSKVDLKVLVIATSSKTRGGITSVINAHKSHMLWQKWNCTWIETHIDKTIIHKLFYAISGFLSFLINLPTCDIVHVHFSSPTSVLRKYLFLCFAKFFKKPLIIHFHAFSPTSKVNENFKQLYKIAFKFADRVLVLSKNWKDGLIDDFIFLKDKITVLYNPCPIINEIIKTDKRKIILYAGILNNRKNFKTLIKSFSKIASKYPSWKIVFAGNGSINEGKLLANKLNISSQVEFKGWVEDKTKHALFSEASIFCLPSYAEGFPMAVLDAWAYSLPVITTPVGGIPDIAIDGNNMLLFDPDDTDGLAKKIEKLITDDQLRNNLSAKSKQFATGIFSIKKLCSELDEIYTKLIIK